MRVRFCYGLLSFGLVLLAWEMLVWLSGWSAHVFPGPLAVLASLWELTANGTLLKHTVASLFRVTMGFYLAIVFGVPLGMLLGSFTPLRRLVNPLVHFLRPISPLAWIPLAMLWFGIGDVPAVFLIFLASFFPLVATSSMAVSSINPTYFQVAANFHFSRWEMFSKVFIPASIPSLVAGLRQSITIAWLVVVAAEMIAVQSGLGYLILDARNGLRMDYVMVAMVVIGVIGLLLDIIMRQLARIPSASWGRFR
ncbi:MAG: ABC transporter permease [Thermodesulfobacteriota bacterium]